MPGKRANPVRGKPAGSNPSRGPDQKVQAITTRGRKTSSTISSSTLSGGVQARNRVVTEQVGGDGGGPLGDAVAGFAPFCGALEDGRHHLPGSSPGPERARDLPANRPGRTAQLWAAAIRDALADGLTLSAGCDEAGFVGDHDGLCAITPVSPSRCGALPARMRSLDRQEIEPLTQRNTPTSLVGRNRVRNTG